MVGGEIWGDVSARFDSIDVVKTVVRSDSKDVIVTLDLVSNRDRPATVAVTDPLPDESDVRELRFVDDTTNWTRLDGAVRFERTIRPEEEVSTEYRFQYASQRYAASSELPSVDVDQSVELKSEDQLVRSGSATAATDDRDVNGGTVNREEGRTETPLSQPPTDEELEAIAEIAGDQFEEAPRVYHLHIYFSASATPDDRVALYDGMYGWFHVLANTPSRHRIAGNSDDQVFDIVVATTDDLSGLASTFEKLSYVDSVTMSTVDDGSSGRSDDSETDAAAPQRTTPQEEFDDLRDDLDVLDAEELLEDDQYVEFVGGIDEFSVPNDELSLDEVLSYPAGGNEAEGDEQSEPVRTSPESLPDSDAESAAPVTEALLDELERGLSDEQETRFRRTFQDAPRSLEVRIAHLQAKYQDMESYADALEAFLDERGTAEEVLDEVRTELTTVREDVSQLRAHQADHAEQLETVSEDLEQLSNRVDGYEAEFASERDSVRDSIDALEDDLAAVREDVDSLTDWRDDLKRVVGESR